MVGPLPAGLPRPQLPALSTADAARLLPAALGVAMVAFSDNMLTGRAFAARNHYAVDNNQELLALGTGNLAAGLAQGFPISSSGSRTAIADALRSRSQLYSLVAVASVAATVLFLRPLLAAFPSAALGAVVSTPRSGWSTSASCAGSAGSAGASCSSRSPPPSPSWSSASSAASWSRSRCRCWTCCTGSPARTTASSGSCPGSPACTTSTTTPTPAWSPGWWSTATTHRCSSPTPTTSAPARWQSVDGWRAGVEWFVLNAEANVSVDITAVDALEDLRSQLHDRGIVFAMARVKQELRHDLAAAGFVDLRGRGPASS